MMISLETVHDGYEVVVSSMSRRYVLARVTTAAEGHDRAEAMRGLIADELKFANPFTDALARIDKLREPRQG